MGVAGDGRARLNDLLTQFLAHLVGIPIVRPVVTKTTTLGAA